MAETAAHLVEHVFPEVPVRQCVLSIHFAVPYDSGMMAKVLNLLSGQYLVNSGVVPKSCWAC